MSTLQADLIDTLRLDLSVACQQFGRARQQQCEKDTPAHRAAVAECLARIDAYLDMWLDLDRLRAAAAAQDGDGSSVEPLEMGRSSARAASVGGRPG
jgi:hypothetical protein